MNNSASLERTKRRFLGNFALAEGIKELNRLSLGDTLVIVPSIQIRDKLQSSANSSNFKFHTEFDAALTFFDGSYPRPLVRELLSLRVIRSKEGSALIRELFALREPGISQARALVKLFDELFVLGRTAQSISDELTKLIHLDAPRWRYLASLEDLYLKEVSKEGFDFKPSERSSTVVLFGLLKLSPLIRNLIAESEIVPFVFDTPDRAEKFNQYGEILSDDFVFKLPQLEFVSTPRNYLECSEKFLREKECGVIVFDENERQVVTQQLKEGGYSIEQVDKDGARCLVLLIRSVLLAFSSKRLFDLLSLLRITAVEDLLNRRISSLPDCGLLTAVDEYQADRLQLKWTTQLLPPGRNVEVVNQVVSLLRETFVFPLQKVTTLAGSAQVIVSWINLLYPDNTDLITELTEFQAHLPNDLLSVEESVEFIVSFISARAEVKVRPGELRVFESLDSAYYAECQSLVLFGAVSGQIPKSKPGSIFLNSSVLKILGQERDDSRVQRYLLSCLANNLKSVVIPRYTLSGDPTSISPLFYPETSRERAEVVLRFFDDSEVPTPISNSRTEIVRLLPKRDLSKLRNKEGVVELSVTALDFYTASPFKFYIERILNARSLTDGQRELEPNQFGDLAHLALRSVQKLTSDFTLQEIILFFERELDRVALDLYGSNISAAVETQFFNLKERLSSYARYELMSLENGWKTLHLEKSAKPYLIETSIEPVLLTARVDRIDFNEEQKKYRVWDYKTGDNVKSIFKRDSSISSLQLPLYGFLLGQGLFGSIYPGSQIEVGHIALGSMVTEPKAFMITESIIDELLDLVKGSAENLVNCRFELGKTERVSSSSDFSIFLNHQGIDYSDEETGLE